MTRSKFDALDNLAEQVDALGYTNKFTYNGNLRLRPRCVEAEARSPYSVAWIQAGFLNVPMDDRWLAFGFNRPSQLVTPEVPKSSPRRWLGANNAVLRWEKGTRATFYRIWKRVVGVDNRGVEEGISSNLEFTFQDLPANSKVEFAVSSVNNGGESAKTEVSSVQTVQPSSERTMQKPYGPLGFSRVTLSSAATCLHRTRSILEYLARIVKKA